MAFEIAKFVEAERLVFGYANVSVTKDGRPLTDLQGDRIDPDELEHAAYGFMLEYGEAGEMHKNEPSVGKVVESVVLTEQKMKAMGITPVAKVAPRWWIGVKVSPEVFEKVKAGQYRMFSIQGTADRIPLE